MVKHAGTRRQALPRYVDTFLEIRSLNDPLNFALRTNVFRSQVKRCTFTYLRLPIVFRFFVLYWSHGSIYAIFCANTIALSFGKHAE